MGGYLVRDHTGIIYTTVEIGHHGGIDPVLPEIVDGQELIAWHSHPTQLAVSPPSPKDIHTMVLCHPSTIKFDFVIAPEGTYFIRSQVPLTDAILEQYAQGWNEAYVDLARHPHLGPELDRLLDAYRAAGVEIDFVPWNS